MFDFDEFYNTIKNDYPDLSKEEIEQICKSIFTLVKETMKAGNLETVRVKYLGSFQVFPGRVKALKQKYNKMFTEDKLITKEYERLTTMIDNYELSKNK